MSSKSTRSEKKEEFYDVGIDTFIERLKKARALNCNPSYIGIDSFMWKKLSFNRPNLIKKLF